jgi:hypothetical protein
MVIRIIIAQKRYIDQYKPEEVADLVIDVD